MRLWKIKTCFFTSCLQRCYCLLLFILIFSPGFSQEQSVFSGRIITEAPLNSPVHIINITHHKGSLSGISGYFSVEVSIGDSLVFSSIQYKKAVLIIDREKLQQKNFIVKLEEELTELEEVKLHQLSGNLAKDLQGIKTFNKFSLNAPMARKPPPTQTERQMFTATTGAGGSRLTVLGVLTGSIPLDPIMNTINGKIARLKKRAANEALDIEVERAIYIISEKTFVEDLEIPENKILIFVYYCAENYPLESLLESPLALLEFFKREAGKFKSFKTLE